MMTTTVEDLNPEVAVISRQDIPGDVVSFSECLNAHEVLDCAENCDRSLTNSDASGPVEDPDLRLVMVTCFDQIDPVLTIINTEPTALSNSLLCGTVPLPFRNNDILVGNVLTFLDASDLCRVGMCSRYMLSVSETMNLWEALIKLDFPNSPDAQSSHSSISPEGQYLNMNSSPSAKDTDFTSSPKVRYRQLLQKALDQMNPILLELQRRKDDVKIESSLNSLKAFLDFTLLRVGSVLPLFSLLATLILFSVQDSKGMKEVLDPWICLGPLYFCWIYYAMSFGAVWTFHHYNLYSPGSPMGGIFTALRGPVPTIYNMCLELTRPAIYSFVAFGAFILLQLVAIGIKLSEDIPSESRRDDFKWAVAFLPTWLSFLLFVMYPCISSAASGSRVTIDGTVLLMVPGLILLVCLAAKLDGEGGRRGVNLDLEVVFVPLWIIEGALLLGVFTYLVVDFVKLRRGYLENMNESLGLAAVVLGFLVPIVLFQALLCVRDHAEERRSVSLAGALAPLMALVFVLLTTSAAAAWTQETPFQMERRASYLRRAGLAVDFPLPP